MVRRMTPPIHRGSLRRLSAQVRATVDGFGVLRSGAMHLRVRCGTWRLPFGRAGGEDQCRGEKRKVRWSKRRVGVRKRDREKEREGKGEGLADRRIKLSNGKRGKGNGVVVRQ